MPLHKNNRQPNMEMIVAPKAEAPAEDNSSLLPRSFDRLVSPANAELSEFIARAKRAGFLGFKRLPTQLLPTVRYYEIDVESFRQNATATLGSYLEFKVHAYGQLTAAQVKDEVNAIVPVTINACMAALYAKLRTIHRQYQDYATRYTNSPTYNKDFELPLPLADAIQSFGCFTPNGVQTHYICVPTYKEGVINEGRDVQMWSSQAYEGCLPYLKAYGIPVKSVDARNKAGSPWWTYKVTYKHGAYYLQCIFPASNYSDHSVMLACMFLAHQRVGQNDRAKMIINHLDDDVNNAFRAQGVPDGIQPQMFAALCNAPPEEWNSYLLVD